MQCNGLSEQEMQKISKLLDSEDIKFRVSSDSSMLNFNEQSMQNNLRHLNSPSISTHVIQMEIPDEEFSKMSSELKAKLLDFGITDDIPSELEFSDHADPNLEIQNMKLASDRKIIGVNFFHIIILSLVIYGLGYFLKLF